MCTQYGICRYDGKSWVSFEGFPTERFSELIKKVQPDPENESSILIFTFPYNNIIRFNGNKFEKLDSLYGEAAHDISCITSGNNGKIYFGVDMKGMMIRKDGMNTLVPLGPDFRDNITFDIKAVNENHVWACSSTDIVLIENDKTVISSGQSGGFRRKIHLDKNNEPWITGSGMVEILCK